MYLDQKSFRQIYDLYFLELCTSLNYYTQDLQMIEDTVQEVFINLWENSAALNIIHIKAYLHTSVRNALFNKMKQSKQKIIYGEEMLEILEEDLSNDDYDSRLVKIKESISLLPPKCRDIFLLHYYTGLTAQHIADIKVISLKTVENQISIALKKIRTEFY